MSFVKNSKLFNLNFFLLYSISLSQISIAKYFLQNLQKLCNQNDVLFIVDEVQTGFYTTGKPWCFQHYDIEPDLVSFGKKSQQCGVFGGKRLDEIQNHCFNTSGRLGATWGGNHIDMIRSSKIIDIIKEDNLELNATERGNQWSDEMKMIQSNKILDVGVTF